MEHGTPTIIALGLESRKVPSSPVLPNLMQQGRKSRDKNIPRTVRHKPKSQTNLSYDSYPSVALPKQILRRKIAISRFPAKLPSKRRRLTIVLQQQPRRI